MPCSVSISRCSSFTGRLSASRCRCSKAACSYGILSSTPWRQRCGSGVRQNLRKQSTGVSSTSSMMVCPLAANTSKRCSPVAALLCRRYTALRGSAWSHSKTGWYSLQYMCVNSKPAAQEALLVCLQTKWSTGRGRRDSTFVIGVATQQRRACE